ncbi:MAG: AsmA-like C-terminal region-containing protein [Pseudomonadota bacterium]
MSQESPTNPKEHEAHSLHSLAPLAWRLLVGIVVLLAVYLALGRLLLAQLPTLREPLIEKLNDSLPFHLEAESLVGNWEGFSPSVIFRQLTIASGAPDAKAIAIAHGDLRIDVLASLASRSLQLSHLGFSGLELDGELREDGTLVLAGFQSSGGNGLQGWLEDFLPNVRELTLSEHRLNLLAPGEESFELNVDLALLRTGNNRQLKGVAENQQLRIAINAQGVGNPLMLNTWTGDIFLDVESSDLSKLNFLWEGLEWPFALSGTASTQLWLEQAAGNSDARLRVSSASLVVEEQTHAWSLPLDALSFEAALAKQDRHWTLLTEDFHVERGEHSLDLDRAQFDWWGNALRVRAKDLGLEALPSLLAAAPGVPKRLKDALPALRPRGKLQNIELRFDDLARPADSWHLRSRVSGISMDSWRNSPAFEGVSGYLELGVAGGRAHLDSRNMSIFLPAVYQQSLLYDSVLGELLLSWDSDALQLRSGLLELKGEEGDAVGKLGFHLPFRATPLGVELGMIVGLTDSRLSYGDRYLPYKLPESLLGWLDRSVRGGDIHEAGFLWRGSTKAGNKPHTNTQLFLAMDDTQLRYDPQWPPLENLSALVLIDDAVTWATAERANTDVLDLSDLVLRIASEDGTPMLRLNGDFSGEAKAAHTFLTQTPLHEVTNGVFDAWNYIGDARGDLTLRQRLDANLPPPEIDLSVHFSDLQVFMQQPGLNLEQLNGTLLYNSASGFQGSRVAGRLLDGDLVLQGVGDAKQIEIELIGSLPATAVAKWLELPLLDFAQGNVQYRGLLRSSAELGSMLELSSNLETVQLDVPRPFAKGLGSSLPMSLKLPLQENPQIALSLGERLHMAVQLKEDSVARLAAAVGGEAPNIDACDQRYCLSGSLSTMDIAAWADFYQRYGTDYAGDANETGSALGETSAAEASPFSYRIDSLSLGELQLADQSFGAARIDLWGVDTLWQGALESAIAQGSLTRSGEELDLLVEYLQIDRFDRTSDADGTNDPAVVLVEGDNALAAGASGATQLAALRSWLPSMHVDVLELRNEESVIGSLGFDLDTANPDGGIYAHHVSGELFGLTLDAPEPGMLRWYETEEGEQTTLEFDTRFGDIGRVIKAAGSEPNLESEKGTGRMRLKWPGAPTDFSVTSAIGSINLEAKNGRLLESRPGALGLISLLNLAEILRGLSMAHMFASGIPFLTASTELHLHEGTVEVTDLRIDGAASAFAFNGVTDLRNQSVNGELVVTLPVANNLPWVAALAGGLPIAAGVFVVSKVFEKQVNRMSSAVYGVSGDISSPDVEFRRLFDDRLKSERPPVPVDTGTGDD